MAVIDNLLSYWVLDEASGNALDAHGSHPGVETSGTIASLSGGRDFEAGDTEYFDVADHNDFDIGTGDFSVAGWIQSEVDGTAQYIMSRQNTGTPFAGYGFFKDATNVLKVQTSDGTLATVTGGAISTSLAHVAFTRSGANILIYINGTPSTTLTGRSGSLNNDRPLFIGAFATPASYFDGVIKKLGFWTKALSGPEVTWLAAAERTYADIVAEASGGMLGHPGMSGGFSDMCGGING